MCIVYQCDNIVAKKFHPRLSDNVLEYVPFVMDRCDNFIHWLHVSINEVILISIMDRHNRWTDKADHHRWGDYYLSGGRKGKKSWALEFVHTVNQMIPSFNELFDEVLPVIDVRSFFFLAFVLRYGQCFIMAVFLHECQGSKSWKAFISVLGYFLYKEAIIIVQQWWIIDYCKIFWDFGGSWTFSVDRSFIANKSPSCASRRIHRSLERKRITFDRIFSNK